MENIDLLLTLATKHWKIIVTVLSFLVGGGYLVARYRTSGMRKMLNAHDEILEDLSTRLNRLRVELENARDELSEERAKVFRSEQKVHALETRIESLERREQELLLQINVK